MWVERVTKLVYESLPTYYDLIPGDMARKLAIIETLIRERSGELRDMYVSGDSDGLVAVVAASELSKCQMTGVLSLIGTLTPEERSSFRSGLDGYPRLTATPSEGTYVSRFAVQSQRRGSGLARDIMESSIKMFPNPLFLHVSLANERARAFYSKMGFQPTEIGDSFATMTFEGPKTREFVAQPRAGKL